MHVWIHCLEAQVDGIQQVLIGHCQQKEARPEKCHQALSLGKSGEVLFGGGTDFRPDCFLPRVCGAELLPCFICCIARWKSAPALLGATHFWLKNKQLEIYAQV